MSGTKTETAKKMAKTIISMLPYELILLVICPMIDSSSDISNYTKKLDKAGIEYCVIKDLTIDVAFILIKAKDEKKAIEAGINKVTLIRSLRGNR